MAGRLGAPPLFAAPEDLPVPAPIDIADASNDVHDDASTLRA